MPPEMSRDGQALGTHPGPPCAACPPTRTHSLEALQLHQCLLVHQHGALQPAVEGFGHQPPTRILGQERAQQPREPALGGLWGDRGRDGSLESARATPKARAGGVGNRVLTSQHLLKLPQERLLSDFCSGGAWGARRPRRPWGAREAPLGRGRRK